MQLHKMIYARKSVRSYTGVPVDDATLRQIWDFSAGLTPLYPEIGYRWEVVTRQQVKCLLPWVTPQLIAIYSQEKEGWLENVGFLFQQMDLYLQNIGLGVCWLGMGRMDAYAPAQNRDDGMKFVMLLAFGHPKGDALRTDPGQFRRKSLAQIADSADPRLEPARLAPSSVNSQPWYFTHDGDVFHAYCTRQGLLGRMALSQMNRIDMGIALAHLYVANPDTFRFFRAQSPAELSGRGYIGSFTL